MRREKCLVLVLAIAATPWAAAAQQFSFTDTVADEIQLAAADGPGSPMVVRSAPLHLEGGIAAGMSVAHLVGPWFAGAAMLTARSQPSVAAVDGRVHVIGGYSSGDVNLSTHEVYDPGLDSWSTLAPLPVVDRGAGTAVGADGRVYVFGGDGDGVNRLYIYNPNLDSWSLAATMTTDAGWETEGDFGADGKLYVFGGEAYGFDRVSIYDPALDSWSSGTAMPEGRIQHGVFRGSDGRFYIVGGQDVANTAQSTTLVYDPMLDSWSMGPALPAAVNSFAGAFDEARRYYWVIGGGTAYFNDDPPYFDSVFQLDVDEQSWSILATALPTARREMGAATVDGITYVIGGSNGSRLATNEFAALGPGPIFVDGFESGDFSAWSQWVP